MANRQPVSYSWSYIVKIMDANCVQQVKDIAHHQKDFETAIGHRCGGQINRIIADAFERGMARTDAPYEVPRVATAPAGDQLFNS